MTDKSNIDLTEEIDRDENFSEESRPRHGPRTVVVQKVDDTLDFTFRHLVAQPNEQSSSFDSTLNGDEIGAAETVQIQMVETSACSSQPMETIFVKQVKQDSKAHDAGLRTGDRIVSINGVNVAGKTYAQVIRLINGSSESALTLMVIPKDEDMLQMAYITQSSDERSLERPSRSSNLVSTCVVSLSPASARREKRFNHDTASFSSSPEKVQGHLQTEGISSSSPSLRIHVRINAPSASKGIRGTGMEVVHPMAFASREQPGERCISGGSSFYPVTTIARKIKPENSVSPQEHYFQGTGTYGPNEQHFPLRANEWQQASTNSYSGQGERGTSLPVERGHQQGSVTYSLSPKHAAADSGRRQSPKLTSYQEITLAKLNNVGTNAPASLASSTTVPSGASSQEASCCSSSHFIQLGAASAAPPPPPSPLLLDSQSPQRSGVSSVIGTRHQMFVSTRPQSYESLFGQNRLVQTPDTNHAMTNAPSKSSSELVDSYFAESMQPGAVSPRASTAVEQPKANLVTERMKRFESVDAAEGVRHLRASKPRVDESVAKGSCQQFGFDSVAKRAALFEQISSEDARCQATDVPCILGNKSEPLKTYRAGGAGEPRELWSSSPASANSRQVSQSVTIPLYFRADPSLSNMRLTSPALRRHEAASRNYPSDGRVSESSVSYDASSLEKRTVSHSSENQPSPKLPARQLSSSHQEKSEKTTDGSCSVTVESFSQSTTLAMAATLGIRDQLFSGDMADSPSSSTALNAYGKSGSSNIKKFVSFFTDKKTSDPAADKKSSSEPLTSGNITYEGCLVCKAAVAEGKKASDRSWKPFWAVLKGPFLCLYKDRYSTTSEDQSVCINSCSVEIASDYVKKRNVFQVTTASGSKFLFQAEDMESMSNWVKAIQANSELKEIKETDAVTSTLGQNLLQNLPVEKTSPQVALKAKKQPSRTIPSSKSPASPSSKSRRPGVSDKDAAEPPKGKEHKTWKGKMVSRFVRNRSGSGTAVEMSDDQEVTGTFGVPLCACLPSIFNECVPLIVETCTKIVEERGIENQGIYRVPGNNCAVNTLRDELNKFPENIDADSEKLLDVNVVSSLLKLFFRKLPDSLITDELYGPVIAAYRLQNPEKKMLKLKKLLHELPEHNFETFRFLAQHLNRVASREDVNKMDARNLAIVFGPTLVRPQDDSVSLMVKDMSDQCRVVETIIVNVDWFFGSWDEDVNVPVAEENEPISSMNPELLAQAENRINPTEMTRDTSAKDLVSSIFHPRKKIRRKDKHKNADSIETEGESDVSFTDRTVDQDLDIQGIKAMLESGTGAGFSSAAAVVSAPTSAGLNSSISAEVVDMQEQKEAPLVNTDAGLNVASVRSAVEVKRYPAYQFGPVIPVEEAENSKPKILRRYSEDAFGVSTHAEPGSVALRPFVRDQSLVDNAQQQLRRLHHDTKALHHKQELERIECEKRAVAKQRVEKEFNKTLRELELEENDSNESPTFSSSSAVASNSVDDSSSAVAANTVDDSSSVRSAMDRCKLAMYENRLRFFTDLGEKKTFSPVFRQGDGSQSGFSSNASPTPLTRRLSDQPSDSLRAEDECLLRASPARAHSVSPSIIGREPKYNFDKSDKISDVLVFSRENSSSFQKLDRSLGAVSETYSSADVASFQPHVFNQPLIFASSKPSAKDFSTSSAGSLTVSFGTGSSTARSSLASSGDQSAKDSVFSEKSPTESEPVPPASADSGFIPDIMTSSIQDLSIQCESESTETLTDVIPGSQPDVNAIIESPSERCQIVGSQEKILLHGDDSLSSKETFSSASFLNESLPETVVDVFTMIPQTSCAVIPSGDISKVNNVKSLQETTIPADFKDSEVNLPLTDIVRDSHLVNLHNKNQLDHPIGNMVHSERTVLAFDSSSVVCSSISENFDSSTDVSLTGKEKSCSHSTDFAEAASVAGDILPSCNLPLRSESSSTVGEKSCEDIVLNGCAVNPSRSSNDDEVQLREVASTSFVRCSNSERNDGVAHRSNSLLPTSVKSNTSPQTTLVAKFPSNATPPSFRFTHMSHCNVKKLQRRHSVGSGSLQDFLPESTRLCPDNPNFRQFVSCDFPKIHPAASLPLLPNP